MSPFPFHQSGPYSWRQGTRLDGFYFSYIDLRKLRKARRVAKSRNDSQSNRKCATLMISSQGREARNDQSNRRTLPTGYFLSSADFSKSSNFFQDYHQSVK